MDRNEEKNSRVQIPHAERVQPVETATEITLPDYRSEISRLLWVRPTVLPPTRFIGSGRAEFSGPIRYNILYMGPDGKLYGAEHEESYAFSVPVEGGTQDVDIAADMMPDAVISRVLGPRKLSVRCRMRARIKGFAEKDLTPTVRGCDAQRTPERLSESMECRRHLLAEPMHTEVGDTVETDAVGGEVRVVSADGTLFMQNVTATEKGILCRGEVLISLLCCAEEGTACEPRLYTRRIPFEKEIPMEGAAPDCQACATGRVCEVRATVEEGGIHVEAELVLWGEGQVEESVILCRDMYLPGCVAECQQGEEQLQTAGLCGNRNFSVSGERALEELGLAQDVLPIHTVADAEITEKRVESGKTLLLGEMHCHVLYRREGEYAVADFSAPFRTVLEGALDGICAEALVPSCRVTVNKDAFRVDGEVVLAVSASALTPVRVLTQVSFAAASPQKRADLEICYPHGGETLWDVGRRYGVPTEELAQANGLSADSPGEAASLAGVKYLIVP